MTNAYACLVAFADEEHEHSDGSHVFAVKQSAKLDASKCVVSSDATCSANRPVDRDAKPFHSAKCKHNKLSEPVVEYLATINCKNPSEVVVDTGGSYCYSGDHSKFTNLRPVDADWAGCVDTRKSTSGFMVRFCGNVVSWAAKKQPTPALSSVNAEYVAWSVCAQEVLFLRNVLGDMGFKCEKPITIWQDNQGSQKMLTNPVNHKGAKHIDLRYHFVRDYVDKGVFKVSYLKTSAMVADILTKNCHV